MAEVVLVVTVKADPGVVGQLKPGMLENAAKSAQEEGCLQFDVIESQDDENSFVFYEVYRDEDALASHRQTPHFLAYMDLLQALGDKVQRSAQLFNRLS